MNKNEWRTPPELFKKYDDIYHFECDVAASHGNHLCEKYFTKDLDALLSEWPSNCAVWCNPPYSGRVLYKWVDCAIRQVRKAVNNGRWMDVVMLLPSRTDTAWFHLVYDLPRSIYGMICVQIDFLKGRVNFLDDKGVPHGRPKEGSIIAVIRGNARQRSLLPSL
jgi:phage N-6-adenine-methyltransferase